MLRSFLNHKQTRLACARNTLVFRHLFFIFIFHPNLPNPKPRRNHILIFTMNVDIRMRHQERYETQPEVQQFILNIGVNEDPSRYSHQTTTDAFNRTYGTVDTDLIRHAMDIGQFSNVITITHNILRSMGLIHDDNEEEEDMFLVDRRLDVTSIAGALEYADSHDEVEMFRNVVTYPMLAWHKDKYIQTPQLPVKYGNCPGCLFLIPIHLRCPRCYHTRSKYIFIVLDEPQARAMQHAYITNDGVGPCPQLGREVDSLVLREITGAQATIHIDRRSLMLLGYDPNNADFEILSINNIIRRISNGENMEVMLEYLTGFTRAQIRQAVDDNAHNLDSNTMSMIEDMRLMQDQDTRL